MSESRNSNSESRRSVHIPRRSSSESRSSSDESRYAPTVRETTSKNKPNYNNLDDIDSLIARLEREMPKEESISPKVNSAYDSRRKKIEELRSLQRQAREEQERQRQISKAEEVLPYIQEGNDELDDAIEQIRQLVKKPPVGPHYTPVWDEFPDDNGESRW